MGKILIGKGFSYKYVDIELAITTMKSFIESISAGKDQMFLLRRIEKINGNYMDIDYGGDYYTCKSDNPYSLLVNDIVLHYPKNDIPYKITVHHSGQYSAVSNTYFLNTSSQIYFDNKYGVFIKNYEEASFNDFFSALLPRQKDFVIKNIHLFVRQK